MSTNLVKECARQETGMCKKTKTACILLLCILISAIQIPAFADAPPSVKAEAIVLADMDSGIILYEKNMNAARSPASLTKIMTGLLAVEAVENGEVSLDDIIAAPADCWDGMDYDSSNIEIRPGEKMTFRDYLYAAMVKSANEACNVIAVAVDGSIQAFVNRMNIRANELGAYRTYFSDTNGLSNNNHYTTAHDLFLITREAMKHELFVDAVNTIDYEIEETNMHDKRYINSSNALLCQDGVYGDGYLYLPASGVKTGYTEAAGYCLISTAEKNNMNLCAVLMGCDGVLNAGIDGYGNFAGTIKLYEWAFKNCEKKAILTKGEPVNRAPVRYVPASVTAELRAAEDLDAVLPKDMDPDRVETRILTYEDRLSAPISTGTVLGRAEILIDGETYAKVNLYTAEDIAADSKELIKARIAELMQIREIRIAVTAAALILIMILFIAVRYRTEKRKHYREITEAEERRRKERGKQR